MGRCNELCTKETTGVCVLCEARAEADRFWQWWFVGGWLRQGASILRQWWLPVPAVMIHPPDIIRESYKQYTDTLNKIMLTVLAIGLFCVLTVVGSPDQALLAPTSTIKLPLTDAPVSLLAFVIVVPFLLVVLISYLHIVFGYWLAYDHERRCWHRPVTGSPAPLIDSLPMVFAFPDRVSRVLTSFIFYWFVPVVLATIVWKAAARPEIGWYLLYVTGGVTCVLACLQGRRRTRSQRRWGTPQSCSVLIVLIGGMVLAALRPETFRRPLYLLRADLSKAWLVSMNIQGADLRFANLQGANLQEANLQEANLQGTNLQEANLYEANLQSARLQGANLQEADLRGANLWGASLQEVNLQRAKLQRAKLRGAGLMRVNLQGANLLEGDLRWAGFLWANLSGTNLQVADLRETTFVDVDLSKANLWGANLQGATFPAADLRGANLQRANLQQADFTEAKNLTQDQLDTACGDENTKLPVDPPGLTPPPPCLE